MKTIHLYVSILLILISIFFIGSGITGMHSLDHKNSFCNQDIDCEGAQRCCLFYQEKYGVCGEDNAECAAIITLSREEKQSMSFIKNIDGKVSITGLAEIKPFEEVEGDPIKEEPTEISEDYVLVSVGLLILLGILIYLIYERYFRKQEKPKKKIRKRKVTKKKRKRKKKK